MIKDLLVSFKDNIKTKTANPFFGTLIAVWVVHNYKFVYTIFNFRASTGLDDRLTFIGTYLERGSFLPDLGWCILWALGVLLSTYILLNLSRLIVLWFEKRITPRVYKITDSKSIVTIDVYNNQVTETKKFEKRYKDEQEAKLDLQNKYDELEKKLQYQMKLKEAREDFRDPIDKEKTELEEEHTDLSERLSQEQKEMLAKPETLSRFTNRINKAIKDKDLINLFNDFSVEVLLKNPIEPSKDSKELLLADLVFVEAEYDDGTKTYEFTEFGTELREYLLENQLFDKSVEGISSSSYYVNKNAQTNGDHEVHKTGCSYMPSSENRVYLGYFSNCQEAMKEAKKFYTQVIGCYYCCNSCHNG